MKILFLDDCNMFEGQNPLAYLVEMPNEIDSSILYILEKSQRGVYHRGGKWREIMEDGKIKHTLISSGRRSDYYEKDYDKEYRLISGTY